MQLTDKADIEHVSSLIRDVKLGKISKEDARSKPILFLEPMSKWHLYATITNGVQTGGRIQYVWRFGIIGVFVLLLACINFMNLSTARSENGQKKQVSAKAMGSLRRQLVYQFFCESLMVVLLAFVFSLLLVQLLIPFFNELADKKMSILWRTPARRASCLMKGLSVISAKICSHSRSGSFFCNGEGGIMFSGMPVHCSMLKTV